MVTISFNCENHNDIILLQTCFDMITHRAVEDSIAMIYHTEWLLGEILKRLEEVDTFDVKDGEHRLEGYGLDILERMRAERKAAMEKFKKKQVERNENKSGSDGFDWNKFYSSAEEYIKTGKLPPAES